MNKSESKCHIARTLMKTVKEINIEEKIFRGKYVADMQGELDLCGNVVSDVPTLVVDTSSDQVGVSTPVLM